MESEYVSLEILHKLMPDFVPKPRGRGTFTTNPGLHFLVMDWLDLEPGVKPGVVDLTEQVAKMHIRSHQILEPYNFGFLRPTGLPFLFLESSNNVARTSSWTEFFRELHSAASEWEQDLHGRHEEMQDLSNQILKTILPALLGRLGGHGRMVRPVLLHGDLHDGDVGLSRRTGKAMIYDPASFYGHHEYELGAWNLERNVIGRAYIDRYLTHKGCGPSDPVEDVGGRLLLYTTSAITSCVFGEDLLI